MKISKMKNLRIFIPLILIIIFVSISACRPSRVVVRDRPPEPHFVQPLAPGPNYIWHSGEWIRNRNTYIYRKGFWIKAPSYRKYYVPGHWQRKRAGWIWISGHWR